MDINSTSTAGNSSGGGSDNATLQLTYAALGISIAAFVLSTLQALLAYLQFDNSEVGRRRCSAELMGELWAKKTKRRYKWAEWRYQIWFEVPVFYTAKPSITVGPLLRKKPRTRMRDSSNILAWIMSWFVAQPPVVPNNGKPFQESARLEEKIEIQPHVETIYKITGSKKSCEYTMAKFVKPGTNEKWANVHTADDEGCSWVLLLDALQSQEAESRDWDNTPQKGRNHTLSYLMQRKPRCWDFMPPNITKPYATTTICHIVEMSAMLGLVWKEFDMKTPLLAAEGNGFLAKCEYVAGLGLMTRFSRLGKPEHKSNRMIPCEEIKRLCFGEVPSLFDELKQNLQVGPGRLDHSLKRLLPHLSQTDRKSIMESEEAVHKFPITFELIAMVANSVHIEGSRFRRLPNPCAHTWNPCLNIALCLKEFTNAIKDSTAFGNHEITTELQELIRHGRMDSFTLSRNQTLSQKIQDYIDATTAMNTVDPITYRTEDEKQAAQDNRTRTHRELYIDLLDQLHLCIKSIDARLKPLLTSGSALEEIVASHLAVLLKEQDQLDIDLGHTSKNKREKFIIDFYINSIYPTAAQELPKPSASSSALNLLASNGQQLGDSITSNSGNSSDDSTLNTKIPEERSAIWLALMFRMWAWLFLHDFNPEDRMIERTELKENRLPVYIG